MCVSSHACRSPAHGAGYGDFMRIALYTTQHPRVLLCGSILQYRVPSTELNVSTLEGSKVPRLLMLSGKCRVGRLVGSNVPPPPDTAVGVALCGRPARKWSNHHVPTL